MFFVERRKEVRTATRETVLVTFLSRPGNPTAFGSMIDLSGRGMRLVLDEPVASDTPLRIDAGDRLYLGEVAYCRQTESGWNVGVEIEQSFQDTRQLEMLRRSLQCENTVAATVFQH
jgi:hypothetical protein